MLLIAFIPIADAVVAFRTFGTIPKTTCLCRETYCFRLREYGRYGALRQAVTSGLRELGVDERRC